MRENGFQQLRPLRLRAQAREDAANQALGEVLVAGRSFCLAALRISYEHSTFPCRAAVVPPTDVSPWDVTSPSLPLVIRVYARVGWLAIHVISRRSPAIASAALATSQWTCASDITRRKMAILLGGEDVGTLARVPFRRRRAPRGSWKV